MLNKRALRWSWFRGVSTLCCWESVSCQESGYPASLSVRECWPFELSMHVSHLPTGFVLASSFPLKAVIFDCDGVLVDTEPLHYQAFQEVLRPLGLGHDFDHYLKYYIGFDDRDAFLEAFRESGRPLEGSMLEELMRAKGKALQSIISKGVSSFPGVVPLVLRLAASGVPLAVASGALHHEVETFIGVLGIKEAFSVVVAADDVKQSKPDPETYVVAIERLRLQLGLDTLEPQECIAIEDTPTGIQSAKSAGLFVIGVANSFPSDQLGEADHVLQSLADLDPEKMVRLIERSRS